MTQIESEEDNHYTAKTIVFVLLPSEEQKTHLRNTILAFNAASQYVADESFERDLVNKIAIQPVVYATIRSTFKLPSQMAVRAISKGIETRKADIRAFSPIWRSQKVRRQLAADIPRSTIDPLSPITFDHLMLSFPDIHTVSILCLQGRERIPARFCYYASPAENKGPIHADLIYCAQKNIFFIHYFLPQIELQNILNS